MLSMRTVRRQSLTKKRGMHSCKSTLSALAHMSEGGRNVFQDIVRLFDIGNFSASHQRGLSGQRLLRTAGQRAVDPARVHFSSPRCRGLRGLGIDRGHVDDQCVGLGAFVDAVQAEDCGIDELWRIESGDNIVADRCGLRHRARWASALDRLGIETKQSQNVTGVCKPSADGTTHCTRTDKCNSLGHYVLSLIFATRASTSWSNGWSIFAMIAVSSKPGDSSVANWLSSSETGMK